MQVSDFEITTMPSCSLSVSAQRNIFLLVTVLTLVIASGFYMVGAWMVMPFAGLELLALALSLHYVNVGADDYESVCIRGDHLVVEKRSRKQIRRVEFSRYWVQVVLSGQRLLLRSHGKEVEFGCFMGNGQRQALARKLKSMTGVHTITSN